MVSPAPTGRAPSDPPQPPPARSASPRRLGPVGAAGRGPEGEGPSGAHRGKPERAGAEPRRGGGLGGPPAGRGAACCDGRGRGEGPWVGGLGPAAVERAAAWHPWGVAPRARIGGGGG